MCYFEVFLFFSFFFCLPWAESVLTLICSLWNKTLTFSPRDKNKQVIAKQVLISIQVYNVAVFWTLTFGTVKWRDLAPVLCVQCQSWSWSLSWTWTWSWSCCCFCWLSKTSLLFVEDSPDANGCVPELFDATARRPCQCLVSKHHWITGTGGHGASRRDERPDHHWGLRRPGFMPEWPDWP